MTKEIFFDLQFTEDGVWGLSLAGRNFLLQSGRQHLKEIYQEAIKYGLHVSFENKQLLDRIAGQSFDPAV